MLQGHILNLFEQRLHTHGVPVSVEFWNGKRVSLGDFPKVKMVLAGRLLPNGTLSTPLTRERVYCG